MGKTTLAAATAVRSAQLGKKTLVMSTDPAHSLGDCLQMEIGKEVKKVTKNLYAEEISVYRELKENWGVIQAFITKFLKKQGFEQLIAEEFAIFPGMEELFSLLKLRDYYETGAYEVAIVDCAPTASTVRMLSFPDVVRWYMAKIFNIERKIVKVVRPMAERLTGMPLPTDDVYASVEDLFRRVEGMKEILTDAKNSSVRLVFNPEKMVIQESQRAFSYLNLFGFSVDLALANRVLPQEAQSPYFSQWIETQQKYLLEAQERFQPLPILQGRLFDREMVGLKLLSTVADDVFGEKDPTVIFYPGRPMEITSTEKGYAMSLKFPGIEKKKIDVFVKGEELIVKVGDFKQNIILPITLLSTTLKDASFREDKLVIFFEAEKVEQNQEA